MMKPYVRIGFSPLNDASLIIVAKELDFFAKQGIEVDLVREASWSNIRDKLAYGLIDAAHMLAPVPLASRLKIGPKLGDMIVPMALSINGNSFVVSGEIYEALGGADEGHTNDLLVIAKSLSRLIAQRRRQSKPRLILAVPFALSLHEFQLRQILEAGGSDPDTQVQWMVVPPSRMGSMLKEGMIDGFCAGAPWPHLTQADQSGKILSRDEDYWSLKPEKVLSVRSEWADGHRDELMAVMRALMMAATYVSDEKNLDSLIDILALPQYVGAPKAVIRQSFERFAPKDMFDAQTATIPWYSHAKWIIGQLSKRAQLKSDVDFDQVAIDVYRPDLWAEIAMEMGLSVPVKFDKIEGGQKHPFMIDAVPHPIEMPANMFFDGGIFKTKGALI